MPTQGSKRKFFASSNNRYLLEKGIFLFILVIVLSVGCVHRINSSVRMVNGIVIDQNKVPIARAIVRVQTTDISATSDRDGRFQLSIPASAKNVILTAWAQGYFNGGPVDLSTEKGNVKIKLFPHTDQDNPDYRWLSAMDQSGEGENQGCIECHSSQGKNLLFTLPVDEWLLDAHAHTVTNPQFLSMYSGTDLNGNQSPLTRYVSIEDYGTEPIKADPSQAYYGPGYKLDFPDTDGNCAACHTPLSAVNAPYHSDPTNQEGVLEEGISCDFCHKIWDIILDPSTGLPYQNMPGVLSYQFRRPEEGHQFFTGPYDDVAPGEDTFSPLQNQSQFCAACHYGVFWDVVVYDSYGEWYRSPYNDPENGQTCQDCHMPRTGVSHFALPEQGGLARDPETIFSHKMPGASDATLLQNAVEMTILKLIDEDILSIQVALNNNQTGHYVPTDSPLRHLILLVNVEDRNGQTLPMKNGPRLPDWCGVGNQQEGAYAGLPGMAYAKILAEQWTNISPTGAYWNPTYVVSDNRLAPFSSSTSTYEFQISEAKPLTIHIQLLYRRAFYDLMKQKVWNIPDILMEEVFLRVD